MTPQARQVLAHLVTAGSITNVEANAVLKCRSVSRRITEISDTVPTYIRKERKRDSTGQRYVRYSLDNYERHYVNGAYFDGCLKING